MIYFFLVLGISHATYAVHSPPGQPDMDGYNGGMFLASTTPLSQSPTSISTSGQITSDGVIVSIDPAIWLSPTPTIAYQPPCTLVLPPWTMEAPITISLPPAIETIDETWETTADGLTGYGKSILLVTITLPPVTTSVLDLSNIILSSWAPTLANITNSITLPPVTLTESSHGNDDEGLSRLGSVTTATFPAGALVGARSIAIDNNYVMFSGTAYSVPPFTRATITSLGSQRAMLIPRHIGQSMALTIDWLSIPTKTETPPVLTIGSDGKSTSAPTTTETTTSLPEPPATATTTQPTETAPPPLPSRFVYIEYWLMALQTGEEMKSWVVYTTKGGGLDVCKEANVAEFRTDQGDRTKGHPGGSSTFRAFGIDGCSYTGTESTVGTLVCPGVDQITCIKDPQLGEYFPCGQGDNAVSPNVRCYW
ncbi:symbiotic chitinase [Apiospora marii]|uniref:Symbiotic chitinase n=1 Tax=Apiospora marii TaxID=335849 RepID=A0ABR1RM28_9PEZI